MRLTTHRLPDLVLTEHEFSVPLDHARPDGEQITVFAREVGRPRTRGRAAAVARLLPGWSRRQVATSDGRDGPGSDARCATTASCCSTSAARVAARRSRRRRSRPGHAQAQADYLKHFRADAIVRDAEIIRRRCSAAIEPWSILGQSYGGFCSTTYLSLAPEGLREAYITGGLPPVHLNDPMRSTARPTSVCRKNRRYFARYPDDVDRARGSSSMLDARRSPAARRQPASPPRRFQDSGRDLWRERRLRPGPLPARGGVRGAAAGEPLFLLS